MDDPMIATTWHDSNMGQADGFANERLSIVPPPALRTALQADVTRRLVVTDAGYFPRAHDHVRTRHQGSAQAIVLVCTEGSGWLRTPRGVVKVGPLTALAIPPGLSHSYGADGPDPWTIWWFHLLGSDLPDLLSAAGADGAAAVISLRTGDRIVAMIDEIIATLERETNPARLLATAGIAWHVMALLATERHVPSEDAPLHRAIRFLEERVDGHISVAELSAIVGVSASHLSALFRSATGGGVLAYHLAIKMALARRLLTTTMLSVTEVAQRVGMSDPLYFSRRFRRAHGVSPREFRRLPRG